MNPKSIDDSILSRITPNSLGAYAVAQGWHVLEQYGDRGQIYALDSNTPSIIVPGSSDFEEYTQVLRQIIEVFANAEDRDELSVLRDLTLADVDQVRLRIADRDGDGSIPLGAGITLIEQSRSILRAAARSAQRPRPAFRGRISGVVINYIRSVRLGQTEQGSYVVNLLSPVPNPMSSRLHDVEPFARRVTRGLASGLQATRESLSILNGHYAARWFEDAVRDGVSANLSDAVARILKSSNGTGLDISVSWALTRPVDEDQASVSFDSSDAPLLEHTTQVLKGLSDASSSSDLSTTSSMVAPPSQSTDYLGEQLAGHDLSLGAPPRSAPAYGTSMSGVSLRSALTQNERSWLDEYARQLREHFPGLIENIVAYTLDEDDPSPDLQALILIRSRERTTERDVSMLGHMIDMSGYFVAPLIKVFTTEEWAHRQRIGDPIYRMVVRATA